MEEGEAVLEDVDFAVIYQKLVRAARKSFVAFLYFMWPQQDGQAYIIGDLHEYLATMVDGVAHGSRRQNQSVSVPPQHGKSRLLSVRSVAWLVGFKKGIHIAMTGYYRSLLIDFLREAKEIISSSRYQEIFPDIAPIEGYNRADAVTFSNGGSSVQCRSCGSKLVGRRVDWLIVDDPHAGRKEAESPAKRKDVHQWFFADCVTRLSPDAKTFLISTRWHPEDLHAKVTDEDSQRIFIEAGLEEALFEVTNIPAVCDDPETDPLGREEGEACFPEQRNTDFLHLQKTKFTAAGEDYEWWSQYQGQPKPKGGDLADTKKIIRISRDQVPDDIEWVRGIDPAIADNNKSDFTAGALCAARFDSAGIMTEFYLIDMFKKRGPYAARKSAIENALDSDNLHNHVTRAGVEGVSGFEAIVKETKAKFLGRISIKKKNFRGTKTLRAQPWFNLIEAGRFYMVSDDWNADFIQELQYFPSGKHDDQIDAVSIAREVLIARDRLLLA